jgi:hypothetical protein
MKAHVPLSQKQRKTINREINRQCMEYEKMHEAELVCRSLWILYSVFGWGATRLTRFYKAYQKEVSELVKHYELEPEADGWLCMRKLHDAGFDFVEGEEEE